MKITAIVGSARKDGKTAQAVHALLRQIDPDNVFSKIFFLCDYSISPCSGCEYCRSHEGCPIKDDMPFLLDELLTSDTIIWATPIYFGEMSGMSKTFADRLYPTYRGKGVSRLKGKLLYLLYSQHSESECYKDTRFVECTYLFRFLGLIVKAVFVNGKQVTT